MNALLPILCVVVAPLLFIWGTGLAMAAFVRWFWRDSPLPPPDPDLSGDFGYGESFILAFRRMTWEEIISQLSGVTLSLTPPLLALAGMLAWGWPKWSLVPAIGLMIWVLLEYNAWKLGATTLPHEKERRFVVHPLEAAEPARRGGKYIPLPDIPVVLGQYAEVALCHVWQDNLLLWVQDRPVVLRGVREMRRGKNGAWQIAAGRLCLPWNGPWDYSTTYYRKDAWRVLRIFWVPDKPPYPDQATWRLGANAPLVTLSPQASPASAPPAPAARFAPPDDAWWAQHIAGKAFRIQAGSQTLGAEHARQVRFRAAFERPGSWVGITETDDILLLDEIARLEPTPEGGLTFIGREGKYGPRLRVCFDSGGVTGSTECAVPTGTGLRFYSITLTGAHDSNADQAPPQVTLVPVR